MKTHSIVHPLSIIFSFFLAAGLLAVPQASGTAAAGCILRVNGSAAPGGDGSTWPNAYNNLQTAFNAAVAPCQVWVEQGIYKPAGARLASFFLLKNGVGVYGGFNGSESNLSDRNWNTYPTILSGDIGVAGNATDNAYNVIYDTSGVDYTAVLDGFTIEAGNANCSYDTSCQEGGGVYLSGGSPTLGNLKIQNNNATLNGGGVYIAGGSAYLEHSTIQNNTAGSGAGVYLTNHSNVSIWNVTFTSNSGTLDGGGLFNDLTSTGLVLISCNFFTNHASHGGGGAYIYGQTTGRWLNFSNNTADFGGGLIVDNGTGSLALSYSMLAGNTATSKGGGAYIYASAPAFTNILFIRNTAVNNGGGAIGGYKSSPTLTNVTMSGNSSTVGGGIYNYENSHPVIRNSILWGDGGGEFYNDPASITANTITVTYSLAQGCNPGGVWNSAACGTNGGSNLADSDPFFINPASDNFRLQGRSPAINKGNNTFVSGVTTDLDSNARIFAGIVDLGPYECIYYRLFLPLVKR